MENRARESFYDSSMSYPAFLARAYSALSCAGKSYLAHPFRIKLLHSSDGADNNGGSPSFGIFCHAQMG
jgi:hypothetical protein